MSPEAAVAMKACLGDVGSTLWEPLHEVVSQHDGANVNAEAIGAAASHSTAARLEAVGRVLGNHFRLLLDITNPSGDLSIENRSLTQTTLTRVPPAQATYVDEALREAVRRLQGFESHQRLSDSEEATEARATASLYLKARIQSAPQQKPGRAPDMSAEAASAFKAVFGELAGEMPQSARRSSTRRASQENSSSCLLM